MNSNIFLYDGSFEGLLTAVACAVKSNTPIQGVYDQSRYNPRLFDTIINISTNRGQATRLFDYLRKLKGKAARYTMDGYLSEEPEIGTHLYKMVEECLLHGTNATENFTNDSIKYLNAVSERVFFEMDRYTGLLRFRILEDGLQYAPFEANHNIIGYLADHFKTRLQSRRWILHDIHRNYALYWDTASIQTVDMDGGFTAHVRQYGEVPEDQLHETEQYYQDLWKIFHKTIAISNRENPKLQAQFMPQRYWKYLIETQ